MHTVKSAKYESESTAKNDNSELTGPLQAKQGKHSRTFLIYNNWGEPKWAPHKQYSCAWIVHVYNNIIIMLRLDLSVCACVRAGGAWPEAIGPEVKSFLSWHYWSWDVTTDSPLTWHGMAAPSRDLSELLQKDGVAELDWIVYLHMVACWTQRSDI